MKFIRKNSPGPLSVEHYGFHSKVIDGEGNVIAKVISRSNDADGMACFGLMLDYLVERAGYLSDIIIRHPNNNTIEKKELKELVDLIKKAGVEVVE